MKQETLPLVFTNAATVARDDALSRVTANVGAGWIAHGLRMIEEFARTRPDFIGEEFRQWAQEHGLPAPHHHNAWGALLRAASTRGVIRITERARQMKTRKSHARRSPIWERS